MSSSPLERSRNTKNAAVQGNGRYTGTRKRLPVFEPAPEVAARPLTRPHTRTWVVVIGLTLTTVAASSACDSPSRVHHGGHQS